MTKNRKINSHTAFDFNKHESRSTIYMVCSCGKKEATVHVTEILEGQVKELHLCEACAKEQGTDFKQFLAPLHGALPDIAGMFSKAMGLAPGQEMKCTSCGMTMGDFERVGRLGCAGCYKTFAPYLTPLLKRIHRHGTHTGKKPPESKASSKPVVLNVKKTKVSDLALLRKRLNACIKKEAYEDAAQVRDEIQKYKKSHSSKKGNGETGQG